MIEKHFTIDKTLEGNDHQVSLLPEEFAAMVARIREIETSSATARHGRSRPVSLMNRANLAKSLVATRSIAAGETITRDAVDIKSPGAAYSPITSRNSSDAPCADRLSRVTSFMQLI